MNFKKDVLRNLAMITQIGISVLAPIVLCVFIGYELDGRLGWSTTLPLLILGILAGGRNGWMLMQELVPKDNESGKKKGSKNGSEK